MFVRFFPSRFLIPFVMKFSKKLISFRIISRPSVEDENLDEKLCNFFDPTLLIVRDVRERCGLEIKRVASVA